MNGFPDCRGLAGPRLLMSRLRIGQPQLDTLAGRHSGQAIGTTGHKITGNMGHKWPNDLKGRYGGQRGLELRWRCHRRRGAQGKCLFAGLARLIFAQATH
jgi:hypothetical protein